MTKADGYRLLDLIYNCLSVSKFPSTKADVNTNMSINVDFGAYNMYYPILGIVLPIIQFIIVFFSAS